MPTIEIKGLEALAQKLNLLPALKAGIKAAAAHVKGKIAIYPPKTAANTPGRRDSHGRKMGWYIRHRGGFSSSGRQTSSSETLGQKWTVTSRDGGLTGVVGNNVSYGPFVQDAEKQARFHGARGWKTTQTVAEEQAANIRQIVEQYIKESMK